ncbi:MAG TPA: TraB/GumN family protein [Syntrophobacteraceae bacterium]|nr:TraB/GumN family protein [Syntrophobacteraceae bacterium]
MASLDFQAVLNAAVVPEHSVKFMQAVSGGEPFLVGAYLFLAAEDWLLAVGYPLWGDYSPESFEEALAGALKRTRATDCWAICPTLPDRLREHRCEQDQYFALPVGDPWPQRLLRLAERAAASLEVEEGGTFTAAHRKLWAEFTGRVALPPNVKELYARTEHALGRAEGLVLLNAWDSRGRLAACLLVDTAPRRFSSYLLGAHSRVHYVPYASDLLFSEMVRMARRLDKDFMHLGLGVNDGIRRFKTKWGGKPVYPYEMAQWREKPGARAAVDDFMRAWVRSSLSSMSKREYFASLPPQRRFAMLWEMERDGRRSWIGGTAHFFCYSFEASFRELFEKVDTVLFEGPLDRGSLDRVSEIGHNPEPEAPRLVDLLSRKEIERLERVVCGPSGLVARLLGLRCPNPANVGDLLSRARPWLAFFSLWTSFLARQGWTQSVDLEAWQIARDMGKTVLGMETIPEQIRTLESIPLERIVNYLRRCGRWKGNIRRNVRAYLRGDLEGMMGTSTEFPSRTEHIIHHRDRTFLERMMPFIREGRCAVFVGSAHLLNLRPMLAEAGFTLRKCR